MKDKLRINRNNQLPWKKCRFLKMNNYLNHLKYKGIKIILIIIKHLKDLHNLNQIDQQLIIIIPIINYLKIRKNNNI